MLKLNERKKVSFNWKYGNENVSLSVGMYTVNKRIYIGLISHTEDGSEYFADMTVNIPQYSLGYKEAFIYNDLSDELLRFIKENELGKLLPYKVPSGYCEYYIVDFDLEKLREFDPDGVREFEYECGFLKQMEN